PSPSELAPHFPQLEILELMGAGGMGAVYKARQRRLDRLVALKILPPLAAAQLDFGQTSDIHYLVMEYVDGVTLRQAIAGRTITPEQALAIVPQICEALAYAHEAGVVHRDIKPENILLDRQGRVKIADFGLAKLASRDPAELSLTGSRQVMGTPHYMAPEQLENPRAVDHRADIYALGVVFYEMLTGELPLGRFAPPSGTSGVDARLDEVVFKTLEKDPNRRYQHASDVKTDLDGMATPAPRKPENRGATLGQVAREWWHDVRAISGPRVLTVVKLALFVLYLLCMCDFLKVDGTRGRSFDNAGRRYYLHTVGNSRTARPWFRIDEAWGREAGVQIKTEPDAWIAPIFGLLAYYGFWRIKKTETGIRRGWWFPVSHLAFWTVLAAVIALSGFAPDLHDEIMRLPWPTLPNG
ncbi:MAG TPA: serine/threonine-protein kinase, partial [Pirellulales bacterium]|nr:serine/threonine-protein kinase [Pirellulales bacterium]